MKYIYQCYFYTFVGSHSYYRRVTKCGPVYSSLEFAMDYLENYKNQEQYFRAGFIYEFLIDSLSSGKLIYTTDPTIDEPKLLFSEEKNNYNEFFILDR